MLMEKALWVLVLFGLAVQFAYAGENDPILGKVGDYVIRQAELDKLIQYYPPDRQKQLRGSPEMRVALVQRVLEVKILSDLAKKEEFDKNPDVKEQLQYLVNNHLAQEYIFRVVVKSISVSDEEAKKFYSVNEKDFVAPEQVRVRHILIRFSPGSPDDEKRKAREKAEALLRELKEGKDFARSAQEHSEDPGSKQSGGDLGYFARGEVVKPFEEAAFSLQPGQISDLVETQFGYHILKAEDRKESMNRPFEEVKDTIKAKLQDELAKGKVEAFIKKVTKEANMEVYPDGILAEPRKN